MQAVVSIILLSISVYCSAVQTELAVDHNAEVLDKAKEVSVEGKPLVRRVNPNHYHMHDDDAREKKSPIGPTSFLERGSAGVGQISVMPPLKGGTLKDRTVVLSFDDGPNQTTSLQILDVLASEGIQAMFFHVGKNIVLTPGVLDRFRANKQFVGVHTYHHLHLTKLNHTKMASEIDMSMEAFKNETGERPWFFRAPYGQTNADVLKYLDHRQLIPFGWDADSYDWHDHNNLKKSVRTKLGHKGGIILLHEFPWTGAQLKEMIASIRASNFSFASPLEVLPIEERVQLAKRACPSRFHPSLCELPPSEFGFIPFKSETTSAQ